MEKLVLNCTITRCNVDGSEKMSVDKCVLNNGSPCYYMAVKDAKLEPEDDSWKKFDSFVKKKSHP